MKGTLKLLVAIAGVLFVFIGQTADIRQNVHVRVAGTVTTLTGTVSDEFTNTRIENHLKRELRALPDVDLVAVEDASIILLVLPTEIIYQSGLETGGIALAYTHFYNLLIASDIIDATQNRVHKSYLKAIQNKFTFSAPYLGLEIGSKTDLTDLCKNIVLKLDKDALQPMRQ